MLATIRNHFQRRAADTLTMEDFADVARARASFQQLTTALAAGRDIMRRAGVSDPPPVPDFDAIFHRLDAPTRQELYTRLRTAELNTPADTVRFWQPFIRRALH